MYTSKHVMRVYIYSLEFMHVHTKHAHRQIHSHIHIISPPYKTEDMVSQCAKIYGLTSLLWLIPCPQGKPVLENKTLSFAVMHVCATNENTQPEAHHTWGISSAQLKSPGTTCTIVTLPRTVPCPLRRCWILDWDAELRTRADAVKETIRYGWKGWGRAGIGWGVRQSWVWTQFTSTCTPSCPQYCLMLLQHCVSSDQTFLLLTRARQCQMFPILVKPPAPPFLKAFYNLCKYRGRWMAPPSNPTRLPVPVHSLLFPLWWKRGVFYWVRPSSARPLLPLREYFLEVLVGSSFIHA